MSKSLYSNNDPVQILSDEKMFYTPGQRGASGSAKILPEFFKGAGALKAYAPWCPHCVSKVECINTLAGILKEEGFCIYVVDAEDNQHFSENLDVKGFPTFFKVNEEGIVGPQLKLKGSPVGTVKGIVQSLCDDEKGFCKHVKTMDDKGCQ